MEYLQQQNLVLSASEHSPWALLYANKQQRLNDIQKCSGKIWYLRISYLSSCQIWNEFQP